MDQGERRQSFILMVGTMKAALSSVKLPTSTPSKSSKGGQLPQQYIAASQQQFTTILRSKTSPTHSLSAA